MTQHASTFFVGRNLNEGPRSRPDRILRRQFMPPWRAIDKQRAVYLTMEVDSHPSLRASVFDALSDLNTFHFTELIEAVAASPAQAELGALLQIFAFGSFSDFVGKLLSVVNPVVPMHPMPRRCAAQKASLPQISAAAETKLKMLTLLSLVQEKKVRSYLKTARAPSSRLSSLAQALRVEELVAPLYASGGTAEVEDVAIRCIDAGLLQATLDEREGSLQVGRGKVSSNATTCEPTYRSAGPRLCEPRPARSAPRRGPCAPRALAGCCAWGPGAAAC